MDITGMAFKLRIIKHGSGLKKETGIWDGLNVLIHVLTGWIENLVWRLEPQTVYEFWVNERRCHKNCVLHSIKPSYGILDDSDVSRWHKKYITSVHAPVAVVKRRSIWPLISYDLLFTAEKQRGLNGRDM